MVRQVLLIILPSLAAGFYKVINIISEKIKALEIITCQLLGALEIYFPWVHLLALFKDFVVKVRAS